MRREQEEPDSAPRQIPHPAAVAGSVWSLKFGADGAVEPALPALSTASPHPIAAAVRRRAMDASRFNGSRQPRESDYTFLRPGRSSQAPQDTAPKTLSSTDVAFLSRMDDDIDTRRREGFINELKKHPNFKPSMLLPPKSKFKEVSLTGGPIIKSHKSCKTGLETAKPYKWGPLGGWY